MSLLATGGCATENTWQGSIEVRDGATFVSNPEAPLWSDVPGEPARLTLELEQTFGADADPVEAILGQPFSLYATVDASGNVYVLDGQAGELVKFDAEGGVVWRVGRKGEGPGELDNPAGIAMRDNGALVITNRNRSRINQWDADGNFVSALALNEPPLALPSNGFPFLGGFAGADALVLYGPLWGHIGSYVSVLDIDGSELTANFEWDQLPDVKMPSAVAAETPVRGERGLILAGSSAGYQFRIYSQAGDLQMHVTRAVDYPVRAGFVELDGLRGVAGFGQLRAPMHLDPDYLLVAATWTTGVNDPDATATEVKASSRIRDEDLKGLRILQRKLGDRFVGGLVLYLGERAYKLENRLYVVPLGRLWS